MPTTWTCWRDSEHAPIHTTQFGWPQCSVCRAAPPYHERPDYLPDDLELGIYVPTDLRILETTTIAPHAAVVGLPVAGTDRTSVYFEGWINGPMQYADRDTRGLWEAGVEHAAGRMVTNYPTIAQAPHMPSQSLKLIGHYHPKTRRVDVDDEEALNAWLNQ